MQPSSRRVGKRFYKAYHFVDRIRATVVILTFCVFTILNFEFSNVLFIFNATPFRTVFISHFVVVVAQERRPLDFYRIMDYDEGEDWLLGICHRDALFIQPKSRHGHKSRSKSELWYGTSI
jgi:hypothetical protein